MEDPAEAFEDLRDKNDLKMLLAYTQFLEEAFGQNDPQTASYGGGRVGGVGRAGKSGFGGKKVDGAISKGKLVPPTDRAWAEKWRLQMKIAGVILFPIASC